MSQQHTWPHARRDSTVLNLLHSAASTQGLSAAHPEASAQVLEGGQADLHGGTPALGLGQGADNVLANLQRLAHDSSAGMTSELSSILAASIGVAPGFTPGSQDMPSQAFLSQFQPHGRGLSEQGLEDVHARAELAERPSRQAYGAEEEEAAESEEGSLEEGPQKSKAPVTEEDRKRRRQEINRQSARRIRERRSHELEALKQQVGNLQHQQQLLLRYAAQLAREKNALVQRTLELTERWNQAAAENLELRSRLNDTGPSLPAPAPLPAAPLGLLLPQTTAHMPH